MTVSRLTVLLLLAAMALAGCPRGEVNRNTNFSSLKLGKTVKLPYSVNVSGYSLKRKHSNTSKGKYFQMYSSDPFTVWLSGNKSNGNLNIEEIEIKYLDQDIPNVKLWYGLEMGMKYERAREMLSKVAIEEDQADATVINALSFDDMRSYKLKSVVIGITSKNGKLVEASISSLDMYCSQLSDDKFCDSS